MKRLEIRLAYLEESNINENTYVHPKIVALQRIENANL